MSPKLSDNNINWDNFGKVPKTYLETRSRTATDKVKEIYISVLKNKNVNISL